MILALANSKLCAPLEIHFPSSVARGHFSFYLLKAHWRKHVSLILEFLFSSQSRFSLQSWQSDCWANFKGSPRSSSLCPAALAKERYGRSD